ncbi:hypothetical protein EPI10_021734 [Gossypium australe]|uniref:Uncharacterized protein n=1 Tax=Gossypium australe TaxID=47621 RepID=A0A5B6WIX0_9ROSI|nr:hypothetical protein EPI10_021734 [Gossypium australe]
MEAERSENNLAELIDAKLQLNFEVDKDESYWEQRARHRDTEMTEKLHSKVTGHRWKRDRGVAWNGRNC